jgi:superfamily II DNA or RNA helicase
LLLYFSTGTGKSISSISIAENFIRTDPKKKIVVMTKNNNLIDNFIGDLTEICSSYTSPEELAILRHGTREDIQSLKRVIKSRINKHYTFVTHRGFINKPFDLSGKIIIVDEIHSLLGNTGYVSLIKALQVSKNYRLVLLSATPMYDNVNDLFQLSNLLNGKVNQFNLNSLGEDGYSKVHSDTSLGPLYDGKINYITPAGNETLMKRLGGKVVYLKVDTTDFPSVNYPNSTSNVGSYTFGIPVVPCYMKGIQEEFYNDEVSRFIPGALSHQLDNMSSIFYPTTVSASGGLLRAFGKAGLNKYITQSRVLPDFLKIENIEQHSTKIYQLLKNLQNSVGKIYIHASKISDDGVPLLAAALKKNGYSKVLVITSEMSSTEMAINIQKFNSKDNNDGSKIKILLGSKTISEGITLKCVRQVHIYEAEWNYSTIDQIKGRAIRRKSHEDLPLNQRTVDLFLYCAISRKYTSLSIDVAKYALSTLKDRELKKQERNIAKSAFSCQLFKNRNTIAGVNGSRECDYQECSYSCAVSTPVSRVDSSTYNVFLHDKETYSTVYQKVVNAFKNSKNLSLADLESKTGVDKKILENVIKHSPKLPVVKRGNIYTLTSSVGDIPRFVKIKAVKKPQGSVKGSMVNGKFTLEIPKPGTEKTNKFVCATTKLTKSELEEICVGLGLTLPQKTTKVILCGLLQKHLGL